MFRSAGSITKVSKSTNIKSSIKAKERGPLSLRVNFSWSLAGSIIFAACQWGMMIVLAKLGNPTMVGRFALGLAITAPIFLFANLQLRNVLSTDVTQDYFFGHYLGLRVISTFLAFMVVGAVVFFLNLPWETRTIILLIGLTKAFDSFSEIYYGLMQKHERMDLVARSSIIRGLLSFFTFGIAIYLTRNLAWGVVALSVSWMVVFFVYDVCFGNLISKAVAAKWNYERTTLKKAIFPCWEMERLKKLALLSLPLGLGMLLISLNVNTSRYFIKYYLGDQELGKFAALAYFVAVGQLVVKALGQSATPRLAKLCATGKHTEFFALLLKLTGIVSLVGGVGCLVAFVGGREFLNFLYGPAYAVHSDVLVLLMVSSVVVYAASIGGYGLTAARYFRVSVLLWILVLCSSVIFYRFFIPSGGLRGAAIALIFSGIFQVAGSFLVLMVGLKNIGKLKYRKLAN